MERNASDILVPDSLSMNFLSYMSLASQIPNLLLNLINVFITVRGDLTKRICTALSIVGAMIIFTMCFIYMDTWSCELAFLPRGIVLLLLLTQGSPR